MIRWDRTTRRKKAASNHAKPLATMVNTGEKARDLPKAHGFFDKKTRLVSRKHPREM